MEYILRVSNLNISLKDSPQNEALVKDLSFKVKKGSILGIVGESGSGKTLTILALMDLLHQGIFKVEGSVSLLKGNKFVEISGLNADQQARIRGKDMAMVFQEPMSSINPNKKCGRQLIEAILIHRQVGEDQAKFQIAQILKDVGLEETERIMRSYPHQLSGGQLQRVMIAMAISNRPSILIADEPTTSLDATTQQEILELIKALTQKLKMTTILISHDPAIMADIADEIMVMRNGEIVESGSFHDLLHSPKLDYTRSILNTREFHKSPSVPKSNSNKSKELPLLEVRNLSKYFQHKRSLLFGDSIFVYALNDVSIKISSGQIHGIVGESGSGKTTLARCLTGLQIPDKGEVYYQSKKIFKNGSYTISRSFIQMVFQDPYSSLNPRMTVGQAIYEAVKGKKKYKRTAAIKLLEEVNLDETFYNRYPHQLSGGQRQRICIARALASNPRVLICDEAVSALDKQIQNKIIKLLIHLKNTYGLTVVFITHDLSVVQKLCDHLTVIYKGRVEESGKTMSIFKEPQSAYTKKLIASMISFHGNL